MEYFQKIDKALLQTIAPGIRRFVFSLDRVMSVYFELDPGAVIAEHSHVHEQMGMIQKGQMRMRIGGKEKVLRAPSLYRIPSREPHEVEILGHEVALVLDIFSPIREDFLTPETPVYMVADKGNAKS